MARLSSLGALRERNFRLLWIGQATSAFGDRIAPIALAFAVLDLTGSAADLGYVLSAEVFPMFVFVLLGGVWADRLPRHLVMMASDLVRMAAQAAIAVLLVLHDARVWELVVLSAIFGIADSFFTPASTGLTPLTVSPGRLQQANALRGLASSMAAIIGPAFGGAIVAAISPGWALAVDAATFLVSTCSLAMLRLPPGQAKSARTSMVDEMRDGWREVSRRRWLWVSISYWGLFNITAWPALRVLGPYVAKQSLGGASAWAVILACGGAGSLVGAMIGLRTQSRRPLFVCLGLTILWWPMLALLALRAPVAALSVACFAAFIARGWGNALWNTILQQNFPPEAISRVSAYDYMGTFVVGPLGYAFIGLIDAGIGVSETLWLSTAIGLAATLAVLSVGTVRELPSHRTERARAELAVVEA